jgi:acyl-coenzyme A synthetase/AMP-(fatty) acid ligase
MAAWGRTSPHKLPERLALVDGLPRTATGKVQKFRLRALARADA